MSIEAMKQALEAFELGSAGPEKLRAMNALRQAIEQAEQAQPFGYFRYDLRLDAWVHSLDRNQGVAFYTAPQQPEQAQPVAWRTFDGEGGYDYRDYDMNEDYRDEYIKRNGTKYASWVEPLYISPPQRKPLTVEHAKFVIAMHTTLVNAHYDEHKNTNIIYEKTDSLGLVRAIEAAHGIKEKNT